jgi:dolichol-phosphate mannosyltransferase
MIFPKEWMLPDFQIHELSVQQNPYALCVFTINEGDKFQTQIHEMMPLANEFDIVIADGGSEDGSTDPDFLSRNNVNVLLIKEGPGRLSAQMRMAFAYALTRGYKGIITVDGNHKDDTTSTILFSDALRSGIDHVQGSRFIQGGKAINTPIMRWLAVRLVHAPIISLASGFHYTDTTNGFRAYSSNLLLDKKVAPFRDIFTTYELHYYLAIRAARLGYRIAEVPVTRSYPPLGKIPTKISPIRGNLSIMKILFMAASGKYNP